MIPPPPPPPDPRIFQPVLNRMPAPAEAPEVAALEAELAAAHGVGHAVAVSSGTAALHTALVACGVTAGDEVLLPAATVMMTVAAVQAAQARPVFVDGGALGDMDVTDLRAKIGPRTRAIIAVHLAGHCAGLSDVADLADRHSVPLIEDACQAQGSRHRGRLVGTYGIGCFSLKDGKILAAGEGGYLLTNNAFIAQCAAAYRTHWALPAAGIPAFSRLGRNYRLPELSAALARHNLAAFDAALARRRAQAGLLADMVGDTPGLRRITAAVGDDPNGYSAAWEITLPEPRAFAARLHQAGVPNSVGTFGLRAASAHPACRGLNPAACPAAEQAIDHLLAVPLLATDTEEDLRTRAETIQREATTWAPPGGHPTQPHRPATSSPTPTWAGTPTL